MIKKVFNLGLTSLNFEMEWRDWSPIAVAIFFRYFEDTDSRKLLEINRYNNGNILLRGALRVKGKTVSFSVRLYPVLLATQEAHVLAVYTHFIKCSGMDRQREEVIDWVKNYWLKPFFLQETYVNELYIPALYQPVERIL